MAMQFLSLSSFKRILPTKQVGFFAMKFQLMLFSLNLLFTLQMLDTLTHSKLSCSQSRGINITIKKDILVNKIYMQKVIGIL